MDKAQKKAIADKTTKTATSIDSGTVGKTENSSEIFSHPRYKHSKLLTFNSAEQM
ncbi:MAG: hypothetical protein V4722_04465 [Bacteroidota bacterium]